MKNITAELNPGCFYHVFNRTNNGETLFKEDENKAYFLRLINKKLVGFVNIYAYSLLRNHFHLSISIPERETLIDLINSIDESKRTKLMKSFLAEKYSVHDLISHQFSRVFNSYAQAFNKSYNRHGNLFNRPFKRALIRSENDFGLNIYYIHHNARKHGIVTDFKRHKWNSYHDILASKKTFLKKDYLMNYFGGLKSFIAFHDGKYLERDFENVAIEE